MQEYQEQRPGFAEGQSREEPADDPALLESVLRETVAMCAVDEPLDEPEREAIEEVARRHAGQPFALQPVLTGLVEAVLRTQFADRLRSAAFWPDLTARVAETLFDDPVMRPRLERFWAEVSRTSHGERA
ncbi:MAG: hypothetical protein HY718_21045 [Planctomycetes bacterium]|nr:hypothetical protein [Planctomycetota bacterium]